MTKEELCHADYREYCEAHEALYGSVPNLGFSAWQREMGDFDTFTGVMSSMWERVQNPALRTDEDFEALLSHITGYALHHECSLFTACDDLMQERGLDANYYDDWEAWADITVGPLNRLNLVSLMAHWAREVGRSAARRGRDLAKLVPLLGRNWP